MGLLSKALPRDQRPKIEHEETVKSSKGMYSGFFLGMSEEYTWVSDWPNDKCRACKGSKTYNDEVCFLCAGTGRKTEQRVKLRYELDNGNVEEEDVSFKLSPGGMGRDGTTPLSPSTMFIRLRSLSGLKNPTPAEVDAWYSSLTPPIRIPCSVVINDNKTGSALKITDVLARGSASNGASSSTRCPQDIIDLGSEIGWGTEDLKNEWLACSKDFGALREIVQREVAKRQAPPDEHSW